MLSPRQTMARTPQPSMVWYQLLSSSAEFVTCFKTFFR